MMTFDEWFNGQHEDYDVMARLKIAFDAGKHFEREACAKLCEENVVGLTRVEGISAAILYPFYDKESGGKHEGMTYAKAIRERGE
jgi:hypothetical protein